MLLPSVSGFFWKNINDFHNPICIIVPVVELEVVRISPASVVSLSKISDSNTITSGRRKALIIGHVFSWCTPLLIYVL
jgi:hypothetical protein